MEPTNIEILTNETITISRGETGNEYIRGYAALYYDGTPATEYRKGTITERITRGAFDEVVKSSQNVIAKFNHDEHAELGSTESGTLFLSSDAKGLAFQIPFDPSDPDHQKVKAKLAKGMAKGNSFQGDVVQNLRRCADGYIREFQKAVNLVDISICYRPAYKTGAAIVRTADFDKADEIAARIERARKL